ncbi:MAG TPA: DegV family protein [Anaerolineaceae bacterium]|nr:DegV family protein [Anaerolineaceae bacterium]
MKIAVVTDSTSDLPADISQAQHIEVVPNLLMIENRTYLDGEGISRETFYERLPQYSMPPSTGAPSISVYQRVYERLLASGYTHIISIHPSSALSALFNVASAAAESFHNKVHVFDSDTITLGMGFQAMIAAEAAARGAALDEIVCLLENVRERIHVYALLDTLQYVHLSGRARWVTASLSRMFGLKAIIEVHKGIVQRRSLAHNRRRAVEQLSAYLQKLGALDRFAILHTTPPSSNEIESLMKAALCTAQETIVIPVTTIIGTHVGPKGLGFAALTHS